MPIIKADDLSCALLDMYDLRRALPNAVKEQPKDSDNPDYTIGDLIDDVINTLEQSEE